MITQKPLSENEIIALIARLKCSQKNLLVGDDIACYPSHILGYAASDSLIENVHYRPAWLTPADLAYKLFARNWSDFLCKGIRPEHALLNLNLKASSALSRFMRPFLKKLDELMTTHGLTLIGGDTARAKLDVFTLTFLGSKGRLIPRRAKGIQTGDLIVQLGSVGGSEYARKLLQRGKSAPKEFRFFRRPQLFTMLPARQYLKAAIDQSDSVAKSLKILSEENRLQIHIDMDKMPLSHPGITRSADILAAAEDLAVFAIAAPKIAQAKGTPAFRVIGNVECIRVKSPGVVYRHRGKTVSDPAHDSTRRTKTQFEHF